MKRPGLASEAPPPALPPRETGIRIMAKQSLTPSRRAMLAGLAAAPVAGLPAIIDAAAAGDPIFAAIDRHKAAWAEFSATCDLTDEVLAEHQGREITKADRAAYRAADRAEDEARDALVATVPTTKAGALAVMAWLHEFDTECEPGTTGKFVATLMRSPIFATEAQS